MTYRDFWDKVSPEPNSGCFIWLACTDPDGYGKLAVDGRSLRAHRYAWEIQNKMAPPKNMVVCHKCDVPSCVNPSHLFLATQAENNKDRNRKGRTAKGDKCGRAKLTQAQVDEIRSQKPGSKVAKQRYGIQDNTYSGIINRKSWK